ncbi:hypothetical protein ACP70R_021929 [Stipagrostis hirtigluma subsp. patula]
MSDDSDGQRQCRRGVTVDVELDAAMALADMAGVGPSGAPATAEQARTPPVQHTPARHHQATAAEREEEELASTRLSLELGKVGIQSSPCSSSSSAGGLPQPAAPPAQQHHHHPQAAAAAATAGYGPRPRHTLTEAEKEAKRLRRVLANRESARQTILRRQAIRDELARKVADLSSQNENMKKEKDMVMQEYLSLKEANKQLKEQVARTTSKKQASPARATAPVTVAMHVAPLAQQAEAMAASAASPPATPPQASFLYTAAPPAVPVPYVWGSWPPTGYEHGSSSPGAPLCLPPCAWYYPVVADPRGGSPSTSYPQPFAQDPRAAAEPASGGGSPAGAGTAEEDTDDDPCSLTLAIDVDKAARSAPITIAGGGGAAGGLHHQGATGDRADKAATAAEARKRRKELTKLKHMHAAGRPGGEQW